MDNKDFKVKFTLRWNGDKKHKIVSIKNHEELSKLGHKMAWIDFLCVFTEKLSKANNVTVTLDYYSLQEPYDKWLKLHGCALTWNDLITRTAVIEYIRNHSMSIEDMYKILMHLYTIIELEEVKEVKEVK